MKHIKRGPVFLKTRFIPRENIVFVKTKQEGALINLKDNNFYTLNKTAAKVWTLLKAGKTIEETIEKFLREYDGRKERISQSIKRQIREFLSIGFIEVV